MVFRPSRPPLKHFNYGFITIYNMTMESLPMGFFRVFASQKNHRERALKNAEGESRGFFESSFANHPSESVLRENKMAGRPLPAFPPIGGM